MLLSGALLSFLISTEELSSISLYIIPPKRDIDFSSPKKLIKSLAGAQKSNKTLGQRSTYQDVGHALVEIHCENSKNEILARDFTAVTDKYDYEEPTKIYKEGVGFGFVFDGVEGKFLSGTETYEMFVDLSKLETIYGLRVTIPLLTCLQTISWLNEIKSKEAFVFALNDDPANDLQLGCANFGARVLAKAGAQIPDEWHRRFLVPQALVGGKLTGAFITPESILDKKESERWAKEDEAHFALSFYDPPLIAEWIKKKRKMPGFKETVFTEWLHKHFRVRAVDLVLTDFETNPVAKDSAAIDAAR